MIVKVCCIFLQVSSCSRNRIKLLQQQSVAHSVGTTELVGVKIALSLGDNLLKASPFDIIGGYEVSTGSLGLVYLSPDLWWQCRVMLPPP